MSTAGGTTVSKKRKVVWVGSTPITPISAAEQRRLDKRIKKKHEKLRRRYPEVHGKKVDGFRMDTRKDTCTST